MRKHFEVRERIDAVREERKRLEAEAAQLRGRIEAGEDSDGTRQRLENLSRGGGRRDVEEAELTAEWGEALADGMRRGEVAMEAGTSFPEHVARVEGRASQPAGG